MLRAEMALMAVLVLIAGCTTLSEEQIANKMKEKYNQLEDYSAEVVTEIHDGSEIKVNTAEVKFKKPDKFWIKDRETGVITVTNGNTTWIYNPGKNEVRVYHIKNKDNTPGELDFGSIIKDMRERYKMKLLGSEKVGDRDCYILELIPKDSVSGIKQKLWVDKEYWLPLKIEADMNILNRTVKTTVTYRGIKFNQGLADEEFTFKSPSGVKIVKKELKLPERLTLEEAKKRVNFNILTPDYLPEGYEFDGALVSEINGKSSVLLSYKKGYRVIMLSEEKATESREIPGSEEVDINGNKGEILSMGGSTLLRWKCNGLQISITSPLGREETLRIASSIKCGGG